LKVGRAFQSTLRLDLGISPPEKAIAVRQRLAVEPL